MSRCLCVFFLHLNVNSRIAQVWLLKSGTYTTFCCNFLPTFNADINKGTHNNGCYSTDRRPGPPRASSDGSRQSSLWKQRVRDSCGCSENAAFGGSGSSFLKMWDMAQQPRCQAAPALCTGRLINKGNNTHFKENAFIQSTMALQVSVEIMKVPLKREAAETTTSFSQPAEYPRTASVLVKQTALCEHWDNKLELLVNVFV
ncbi:hypothetical protein NDU88_001753 [Pleurodeles waltl]|uniref:Secreted protein n=1 Tax=Pleurodeles waltl TaxID=8319 RepID=A0AAV7M422_PLEWA|nr:hypothetical protein NDU88_001753 [Pleurodeles waltl]